MKAICFSGVQTVSVQSIPDPGIESDSDVIVKVDMAGLCGSDLHLFFGRETGTDVGTVMGHEFVGTIVETGKKVDRLKIGDRVAAPFTTNCGSCFYCDEGLTSRCLHGQLFGWRTDEEGLHGGQSELVRVPLADATLMRLSDIDNELGLLWGDNLGTAFFCAEMAEVQTRKTIVVIGCGTVGLLTIFAAKFLGAENVIAYDLNPQRRKLAASFGAIVAHDENELGEIVNQHSDNRGADSVLELVGLPQAQSLAYKLLRPGGIMSVIGCHCTPHFAFSPIDAYDKNLTYRTGRCPARYYMERLKSELNNAQFSQLKSLITHQFSINSGVEAYATFAFQKDNCMKATINFDG